MYTKEQVERCNRLNRLCDKANAIYKRRLEQAEREGTLCHAVALQRWSKLASAYLRAMAGR